MANVSTREIHIHHVEWFEAKQVWKFRIEVWETYMGRRRRLAQFPAHGNQLERMKRRYAAQYRVRPEDITTHPPEGNDNAGTEAKGAAQAHRT